MGAGPYDPVHRFLSLAARVTTAARSTLTDERIPMDATDAADQISEAAEQEDQAADSRFRRRAALAIGLLAMLLAITGLGGDNATKEMVNANIQASDTWAFYQAKNVRQTEYRLALDAVQLRLQTEPNLTPEQR